MPLKPTNEESLQLNLTPMIDVVFLLVIFFMAATQFADAERAIELDLPDVPGAGATLAAAPDPMIVSVDASGAIALDGMPRTTEELIADLKSARVDRPDLEVQLQGDSSVDYQHVAAALAACRSAGVTELGMTVEIAARAAATPK